jgi:Domain of unknown function (DUF4861)
MKRILIIFGLMVVWHYSFEQDLKLATIHNANEFICKDKVVSIPWKNVIAKYPDIDTSNFSVRQSGVKWPILQQFETAGTGGIVNLLVLVTVPSKSAITLYWNRKKSERVPAKVYGRFVPERKDDFAWENELIAFRMYGKALQFTNENAHGIDVWSKRTKELIIDRWYKGADYHKDHGEGLDYYGVGNTLGAGNMAPYLNDSIVYPGNFSTWKVLDNGPLRVSFSLGYDRILIGKVALQMEKAISLDAGTRMNKITVKAKMEGTKSLPIVTGIVQRKEPGVKWMDEQRGIMVYWEPAHPQHGTTGVAVADTTGQKIMQITNGQMLMRCTLENNIPYTYYAGACWDKQGDIINAEDWRQWINRFYDELKHPLVVSFQ